jgi:thiol-disulfide isomerase/thioredoxin
MNKIYLKIRTNAPIVLAVLMLLIFPVFVSGQINVSPDSVKTIVIDAEELKNLVKSPEKKQPILINFWATWCGICRKEFPDIVEIHKDYRDKDLSFYIVSVDTVSLVDTTVSDFLKVYQAEELPSYLLDTPARHQIAKAIRQIAPRFAGNYPTTLLYNKNGKLVYQKTGAINPKILRAQIDKVLPKK